MIRPQFVLAGVAIAALAGAGGYVLGTHGLPGVFRGKDAAMPAMTSTQPAGEAPKAEKKLLYYRNPMGLPDVSPAPKKTGWAWITSRSTRARKKASIAASN